MAVNAREYVPYTRIAVVNRNCTVIRVYARVHVGHETANTFAVLYHVTKWG